MWGSWRQFGAFHELIIVFGFYKHAKQRLSRQHTASVRATEARKIGGHNQPKKHIVMNTKPTNLDYIKNILLNHDETRPIERCTREKQGRRGILG